MSGPGDAVLKAVAAVIEAGQFVDAVVNPPDSGSSSDDGHPGYGNTAPD